jgi:hypothetical protein
LSGRDLVLRGTFRPADERRYVHVPFEVPSGVGGLHVAYDYSERIHSDPRLRNGNTLDIGLFDTRGIEPSSAGFRGWSGSHKLEFSLSERWATPPYIPGEIFPGTWHVLLGPYKVGERGCQYEVSITFMDEPDVPPEVEPLEINASRPPLQTAQPGWLRGDLHCHTVYSDGDSWPAEMLAEAVERGLDFLGVTDHNQTRHQPAYGRVHGADLPIVLPGIEVTTYGGHWNAWGTDTWWDFREPTEVATTREMRAAAAAGALVSVNHPKPFGPPWEYPNAVGFHAVEVWNGGWGEQNDVSLAWWDSLLRAGRRVVALGGSDTHHLKRAEPADRLGRPTTCVHVGDVRTPEAVLAALRQGDVFISRDVDGPQVYLYRDRVRVVDGRSATLTLISRRGVESTLTVPTEDWSAPVALNEEGYVRAQLTRGDEMLALTNPVWSPA